MPSPSKPNPPKPNRGIAAAAEPVAIKPTSIKSEHSLGFLLHDVTRLLQRSFARRVRSLGLTQTQMRALLHLARREGTTQVALAKTLDVRPISLSRLIDRMAREGFVERRSDPADRRAALLYMTPKTKPLMAELSRHGIEAIDEAVAGLARSDRATMIAALQHMKQTMAATEAQIKDDDTDAGSNDRRARG